MTDLVVCSRNEPATRIDTMIPRRLPVRAEVGEFLYVVWNGSLYGVAPIVSLEQRQGWLRVVARPLRRVTLPCQVRQFSGYRYRWWSTLAERKPNG